MARIDYDPLSEEENFTSETLNTRFDELAGTAKGVNAIPVSAIAKNSLQHHQVPSLVPTQDISSSPTASDHGQSRSWTVEFKDGEATYGSPTHNYEARVPIMGSSGELRIDFPDGIRMGMSSDIVTGIGVKGLLVLANVHVMTMGAFSVDPLEVHHKHTVVFLIEVATDSARTHWIGIKRTRRSLSQTLQALTYPDAPHSAGGDGLVSPFPELPVTSSNGVQSMRFDVPLRTLLSFDDCNTIYGVRVSTYSTDYGGTAPWGAVGMAAIWSTQSANLSVIPFHAGGTLV